MIVQFLQRARQEILGLQRRRAIERAQAKVETEQQNAKLELFLDDCKTHGLDHENPRDLAIMFRAWCLMHREELPNDSVDDERDPFMRGDL